jgi:alkanesulfonate monooxygenase SsuD/methylene tetrahydromethanopterin reductase-like flavin-dependent oxidoreductase (luciferase family)
LAAVTERVRLGPLVACASFHPPGLIAKMAATIDEISRGRFVLGLGAGWNQTEYRAFGLPYDQRVARFEESFEIVRQLIAGERATLRGRFWQADGAVLLPPPARRVPLMVGAAGERMLAITLPHVEAWNCWYSWYGNTVEGFAELSARIDAVAERVGRSPRAIARSACVLVELDSGAVTRPGSDEGIRPVMPGMLSEHLQALAAAGVDEAILVLRPIDETSLRAVGAFVR